MKQSREVINHLFYPFRGVVHRYKCIQLFKRGLPAAWHPFLAEIKVRNGRMFVLVTHPALLQEVRWRKGWLLERWEEVRRSKPVCGKYLPPVGGVKVQLVPSPPAPSPPASPTLPPPPARGEFENRAQNRRVWELAEEIRSILRDKKGGS